MDNAATVDAAGSETPQDEIADQPANPAESAPAQPDSADETAQEPKKFGGGFQKRIDTLTRRTHTLTQELEAERREKEELKRQLQGNPQPSAPKGDEPPKESDFTDYGEYLRAVTRHEAREAAKAVAKAEREAAEQARVQATAQEQASRRQQNFAVAVEQLSATVPDYQQVANTAAISPEVGQALLASDKGAAVLYHLALHPEDAERVVQASRGDPVRAAIEIARLEAKADATIQQRTRSAAPRQSAPLTPAGRLSSDGPSDKDDMDTWVKKRRAQVYGK